MIPQRARQGTRARSETMEQRTREVESKIDSRMRNALERARRAISRDEPQSPYSMGLIRDSIGQVGKWVAQVRSKGSWQGHERILGLLKTIQGEADALLDGRVEFKVQLSQHLNRIRELVRNGIQAK